MPLKLPDDARMTVAITCDFDAHSLWFGGFGMPSPAALSRGEFGAEVGVPRLLSLFGDLDIRSTWFVPGHSLVTFRDRVEDVLARGHEIAAHGCYHENLGDLGPGEERRLMEIQLAQHAEVTGGRPRGYRSPSWDFTGDTAGLLEDFGFDWDSSLMGREFEPYYPRPVTTKYLSASEFGPASPVLEFPVTWYLDDFPAVEYVPGVAERLGSHREMFARWQAIFDYAYERVDQALYILTVHPQCIGRAHLVQAFEDFLGNLRQRPGLWWPSLSDVYDVWSS